MDLQFWAETDVGQVRDHNEDNFLVDKRLNLFIVCDGMGGHAAGEVASAMSVRIVRDVVSAHREVFERLEEDPDDISCRKAVLGLLEHAIQEACQRVYQSAQEDPSRRGMGTTCSLLMLTEGRGFIGHVGDSRIYLSRQDQIHQITEDHSLMNEMIRLGKIKKGEEHALPHKNAVTRAVGVNEFVEVDTFELDVFAGDQFLICSDGLSGYFAHDQQIMDLLSLEDVKDVTRRGIEFANEGGGKDNITAIVVRVAGSDLQTQDIQRTMEVMRATPYFQYLSYKELVQVVNISKQVEFAAGDVVFEAGSDPESMFVILQGKVALKRDGQPIGTLLPGDHFAESAVVDGQPQPLCVEALEDLVLMSLRRDRFLDLLRREPNLAVKLLWNFLQTFSERLRHVPAETFVVAADSAVGEPTPPSGTLVFEEDLRRAMDSDSEPSELGESSSSAGREESSEGTRGEGRPNHDTLPPGHLEPVDIGPQFEWESAGDGGSAFEREEVEEDLRSTLQMDQAAHPDAPTLPPDASPDATNSDTTTRPAPPPAPKDDDAGGEKSDVRMGSPISGSSVVKREPPRAQILSRRKLVLSDDASSPEGQKDQVPPPVPPEVDAADGGPKKKKKRDTTVELDLNDDGVEEIN